MTNKFDYSKELEAAKKRWQVDDEALKHARSVHAEALAALEAVKAELERTQNVVADYENNLESPVTPSEFEAALNRQRSLAVEVRRAEAVKKREQHNWEEASRTRHTNARIARGNTEQSMNSFIDALRKAGLK